MAGKETGDRHDLSSLIGKIATAIQKGALGAGDLAELRRLNVESPDRPAFWRIIAAWIAPEGGISPDLESRWAMVLSGMSRMAPAPHVMGRRLGRVLAECDYSEARLTALLRSEGTGFPASVRRVCAFLSSRGQAVDWVNFAAFILTTDKDKAEEVRRGVARDYYYQKRRNKEAKS